MWQKLEPVTLTSITNGGPTVFQIPAVKRRAPGFKELAPSGGVYTAQDLVWHLPKVLVDAAGATGQQAPKPGDLVTDGGSVVYTILERQLNTLASTYKCMTRDMILAYQLYRLLSVNRPPAWTGTTDNAGGRVYGTYTAVYSGIAARIQEQEGGQADERGKRLTVKKYTVWVSQRLYLTIEDQIVDDAGNIYEVKSWHDADRIDQLQSVDCELRWPTVTSAPP
jgi:hypothetical protein